MNKREAAIITAITKISFGKNGNHSFHEYVEEKFGHSVFTHEFSSPEFWGKLKELACNDFEKICEDLTS